MRCTASPAESTTRLGTRMTLGALAPLILLAACEDMTGERNSRAWVELGAGLDWATVLHDGDPVQVVLGPQGGHMVALGLHAGGVPRGDSTDPTAPSNPRVTFQAHLDHDVIASVTVIRGLSRTGGALELAGTWLIFDPALPTTAYFDMPLLLHVNIVGEGGESASDEVEVVAMAPLE